MAKIRCNGNSYYMGDDVLFTGDYSSDILYKANQIAIYDEGLFRCKLDDIINITPTNETFWERVTSNPIFRGEWEETKSYSQYSVVVFGGLLWQSTIPENIGVEPSLSNPDSWTLLSREQVFRGTWDIDELYNEESVVVFGGLLWQSTAVDNMGIEPSLNVPGFWTLISKIFQEPIEAVSVTGSIATGEAFINLLSTLETMGIIIDDTTA